MSTVEQRINLKFLAKLGKTPSKCLALLQQVYKKEKMSTGCIQSPWTTLKCDISVNSE